MLCRTGNLYVERNRSVVPATNYTMCVQYEGKSKKSPLHGIIISTQKSQKKHFTKSFNGWNNVTLWNGATNKTKCHGITS